jgi:hypothetical protein
VREFVVAKERWERDHDRDVAIAYNTAVFSHNAKVKNGLKPLKQYLIKGAAASRKAQHPAEQIAMWQIIAMRFGGKFAPLDPKTVIRNG